MLTARPRRPRRCAPARLPRGARPVRDLRAGDGESSCALRAPARRKRVLEVRIETGPTRVVRSISAVPALLDLGHEALVTDVENDEAPRAERRGGELGRGRTIAQRPGRGDARCCPMPPGDVDATVAALDGILH